MARENEVLWFGKAYCLGCSVRQMRLDPYVTAVPADAGKSSGTSTQRV
jgi:hypothetical protein